MSLLDIIFPEKCVFCKKYGNYICKECFNKINSKCALEKINNNFFDYLIYGSYYQGIIRNQLHNFKFHEQSYLYKYFIELILNNKDINQFLKKFDCITYVPMTKNKKLRRGYNQSELLANELGKRVNIKVLRLIEKIEDNKIQSSLSKKERIKNVENVFKISKEYNFNKNVILVDDIFTTGATMRVTSKMLKENGVEKICAVVVSKTLM